MILKGLHSGHNQSGKHPLSRGSIILLMPKGVQRKILDQELAQLGFVVIILDNPVEAINAVLVLDPDSLSQPWYRFARAATR